MSWKREMLHPRKELLAGNFQSSILESPSGERFAAADAISAKPRRIRRNAIAQIRMDTTFL
jgi:hypothetical protein